MGGVNPEHLASAADNLLRECLKKGSHDNMSVVIVVPGAPPSVASNQTSVNHASSRTHDRRPSYNAETQLIPEIDIHTYTHNNIRSSPYVVASVSSSEDSLHHNPYQESLDEVDDRPLHSPRINTGAEITQAFESMTLQDQGFSSPLHEAGGNSTRRQLQYDA